MIIKSTDGSEDFFSNIRRVGGTLPGRAAPARANRPETFSSVLRGKTDTVEISSRRTDGSVLKEIKEDTMSGIGRAADPVTLEGLKSRIAAGDYSVSADELAQILSE